MSDKIKQEAVSIFITFLSSFLLAIAASIQAQGTVLWSTTVIMAIIVAGARAGVKAVVETKMLDIAGIEKKV